MRKRIISFSLYGNNPDYHQGALRNLELSQQYYPGWTCRFFVSQEILDSLTAQLRAEGAEVILKVRKNFADGTFWRFLTIGDLEADCVIVRDVDSRLGQRERDAVEAWIESGRGTHIMRDHPLHQFLILAGLWGCRHQVLANIAQLVRQWIVPRQSRKIDYRQDEKFLAQVIYPMIKNNVLIHSDYVAFEGENVVPFPSKRKNREVVGTPVRRDVPSDLINKSLKILDGADLQVFPLPISWHSNES